MARKDDGIFSFLVRAPWWVSVCLTAFLYVLVRFVLPAILARNALFGPVAPVVRQYAWLTLIFLIPGAWSAFSAWCKRKMLDRQSGIDSIRALSWKEFEELLAEAYRRQGYAVEENATGGPDGGVDIRLRKDGELVLVQCKQWHAYKVGVNVVREMLGLMTAERAARGIVVTSGTFTEEAERFAEGKPITLIEGDHLERLIRAVQTDSPDRPATVEPPTEQVATLNSTAGRCPKCGRDLVVRVAKRGANAGGKFLGCSGYPACRHTQPYET